MAHSRVTVSLPPEVASDLEWLSRVLGMSRSAIVSDVLGDAFSALVVLIEHQAGFDLGGVDDSSPQLRRLRGASADAIREEFAQLRRRAREIDPDSFELRPTVDGEA